MENEVNGFITLGVIMAGIIAYAYNQHNGKLFTFIDDYTRYKEMK